MMVKNNDIQSSFPFNINPSPPQFAALRATVLQRLGPFVLSQHVEVAERASLSFLIVQYHEKKASLKSFYPKTEIDVFSTPDFSNEPEVDLDTPFYEVIEQKPTFLAPQEPTQEEIYQKHLQSIGVNPPAQPPQGGSPAKGADPNAIFNLSAGGKTSLNSDGTVAGGSGEEEKAPPPKPVDALAAMRAKMTATKQNYTVQRKAAPGQVGQPPAFGPGSNVPTSRPFNIQQNQQQTAEALAAQIAAMNAQPGAGPAANQGQVQALTGQGQVQEAAPPAGFLPAPTDKQIQDNLNRNWAVWAEDENVCVYLCVKNKREQSLRLDLRVERKAPPPAVVSNVRLSSADDGIIWKTDLVPGVFSEERSGKIKTVMNCQSLSRPGAGNDSIPCQISYELASEGQAAQAVVLPAALAVPTWAFLHPRIWSEDEIGGYIADFAREHLSTQAGEICRFPASALNGQNIDAAFPAIVARAAAMSGFHGIKQSSGQPPSDDQSVPRKFLLISQVNSEWSKSGQGNGAGGEGLPHLVSLCAASVKGDELLVKVTVKADDQPLADAVKTCLAERLTACLE